MRMVGKRAGSCCVLGGPECWGPLHREGRRLLCGGVLEQVGAATRLTHSVACGRAECCSAPPWGASGGRCTHAWGTASSPGPSRSPPDSESRIHSSENTAGQRYSLDSERTSAATAGKHPPVLTRPQSPTCHVMSVGQDAISQRWTVCGRRRWAQDSSSLFPPLESTQVTSLVCSPDPHVTEHCRHKV